MTKRTMAVFAILFVLVFGVTTATNHYFIHPPDQVVGNIHSHIFHTLECSTGKQIKDENRVYFDNSKEALSQKYRPCKLCNPK